MPQLREPALCSTLTGFDRKLTCSLIGRTQTKAHFPFLKWWVDVKMPKSCQASNELDFVFFACYEFMLIPFIFFY